jgi:nucleoside-diphosphate-sugar epimerase
LVLIGSIDERMHGEMEPDSNKRTVVVFGGTGFLGRRIVRHLRRLEICVRVASRHSSRSREIFGVDDPLLFAA